VIRHERAVGGAAARNTGLREAGTPIVAFLDDDDEWLPAKMEIQLAWLRITPRHRWLRAGICAAKGGMSMSRRFRRSSWRDTAIMDNFFGSFSYLVVRRPRGGIFLDPELPALQDWDFALRVTRYSSFGVIEEPLVKYYAHDLPRITNRPGNHLRGLRHCHLKHRFYVSVDARRWLLGVVIFEALPLHRVAAQEAGAGCVSIADRGQVPGAADHETAGHRASRREPGDSPRGRSLRFAARRLRCGRSFATAFPQAFVTHRSSLPT